MTERFRFLQGGFRRLRAAGEFRPAGRVSFWTPRKKPKRRQGAAQDERFALIFAHPTPSGPSGHLPLTGGVGPGPHLRGLPLGVGKTFPARKIRSAWVRFLPGHWALGLWKIGVGAVPLLRLPFPNQRPEAVFRRRGAQCAPAGRSGTGPYAETDAFPDTPQGQVSSPARRRQRSSCRGGYQPPEAARWGHRALQKSKHVFGYAAGTAPCGRLS